MGPEGGLGFFAVLTMKHVPSDEAHGPCSDRGQNVGGGGMVLESCQHSDITNGVKFNYNSPLTFD